MFSEECGCCLQVAATEQATVYKPTDLPTSSDSLLSTMAGDENPPGDTVGGNPNKDKTISDLVLGVINWWCLKFGKNEVVNLVMRHFGHSEVYNSCLILADTCGLATPINHKNTAARSALDPCANDIVKIMKDLVENKKVPNIVIPATELGKVPLDALSVSDERSVGARLESLENSVQSVISAVEKLTAVKVASQPSVSLTPAAVSSQACPVPGQTFAHVAAKLLQPCNSAVGQSVSPGGHLQQVNAGRLGNRVRSRSPQVKRGPDGIIPLESDESDGYRRQGRPRYQNRQAAAGASRVVVEEVGVLQPSLQYYIGNTPGRATEEVIKKVLEKCAVPLLDGKGPLIIEGVHCLTKDPGPRTKCWRVVVPPEFKDVMENSQLYPEAWRFREFVGVFRSSPRNAKKLRRNDNDIVDQVMAETSQQTGQDSVQLLHSLQQQVLQLVQQQGGRHQHDQVVQDMDQGGTQQGHGVGEGVDQSDKSSQG